MKKLALIFVLAVAFFLSFATTSFAASSYFSFDPTLLTLTPGESVVGSEKLMPNLVISNSGGNDVSYIKSLTSPLAYGANTGGVMNVTNACLPKDYGIADLGSGAQPYWQYKNHDYNFSFIEEKTAKEFSVQIVDFGDFMPFGACPNGKCTLQLIGYDEADSVIDTDEMVFTNFENFWNYRTSLEYGNLSPAGDACESTPGQPGNFSLSVKKTGGNSLSRIELKFLNKQSMDPNIAIGDIFFKLDK
ncbi:MAG: hypothetical protein AAB546_03470 [Patescibacteria group bacterium]